MRKSDYHYLLGLLKENAGWDFDDDEYFIIDKRCIILFARRAMPR